MHYSCTFYCICIYLQYFNSFIMRFRRTWYLSADPVVSKNIYINLTKLFKSEKTFTSKLTNSKTLGIAEQTLIEKIMFM